MNIVDTDINILPGNLFNFINRDEKTCILHICNDQKGYGRGFAYDLSHQFPRARSMYRKWYDNKYHFELGNIQYVKVDQNTYVINMLAQHGYYDKHTNPQPIDYDSLRECLKKFIDVKFLRDAKIILPKIGTGNAKGDWDTISQILLEELKDRNFTVYDKNLSHSKDIYKLINQIPIVEYANTLGLTPVRKGTKYFSLAEADSVMIDITKNCFWRNSKFASGFGGVAGGIIEFLVEFDNEVSSKADAIAKLKKELGINPNYSPTNLKNYLEKLPPVPPRGDIELPKKDTHNKNVYAYLLNTRKIKKEVINYYLDNNMLYQDIKKNCVWVTYDENNKPDFASLRSTGYKKFAMDVVGCDYNKCFYIKGNNSDKLVVSEAIIDQMSVMSKLDNKKSITDFHWLSVNGTNKIKAIFYHLDHHPEIKKIYLAFDNDKAGKDAIALVKKHIKEIGWDGNVYTLLPVVGKDWNQRLQYENAIKSIKDSIINDNNRKVFNNPINYKIISNLVNEAYAKTERPKFIKENLAILKSIEDEDDKRRIEEYKKKEPLTVKMSSAALQNNIDNSSFTNKVGSSLNKSSIDNSK